jgi:uncharacterized RDD family membrane protein YckC
MEHAFLLDQPLTRTIYVIITIDSLLIMICNENIYPLSQEIHLNIIFFLSLYCTFTKTISLSTFLIIVKLVNTTTIPLNYMILRWFLQAIIHSIYVEMG